MAGYKVRTYKGNPFKPRPHLRVSPKSRRHHPISGGTFCIRAGRCKNDGKAGVCGDSCVRYSGWDPLKGCA
jgi:hypothetical protein